MSVLAESELVLEPDALALRGLGDWLRRATDHLDGRTATALLPRAELAVHEACMNVVDHARPPEGSVLELALVLTTDRLTVRVRDEGEEFRIADVPVPRVEAPQERGYGVKIIRALVSDLDYRRVGSVNEMELHLDIAPPAPDTPEDPTP